jgi:hypothetical protein
VDATRINSNSQPARIAIPASGMCIFAETVRQKNEHQSKRQSLVENRVDSPQEYAITKQKKLKTNVTNSFYTHTKKSFHFVLFFALTSILSAFNLTPSRFNDFHAFGCGRRRRRQLVAQATTPLSRRTGRGNGPVADTRLAARPSLHTRTRTGVCVHFPRRSRSNVGGESLVGVGRTKHETPGCDLEEQGGARGLLC